MHLRPWLLAATLAAACGLSDEGFTSGRGRVEGVVLYQLRPLSGVEISISTSTLTARSDEAGRFAIDQVPAGKHLLLAREPGACLAAGAAVRVAAGVTSRVQLLLEGGGDFALQVQDPDLPLAGFMVGLQELPGLEATTDWEGRVSFTCLPAGQCYTPEVRATPLPLAFSPEPFCPEGPPPWPEARLEPEESPYLELAQALNALLRADTMARGASACRSECRWPAWWEGEAGPPCPRPLGDEFAGFFEELLQTDINRIRRLERLGAVETEFQACPPPGALAAACRQGGCTIEQPAGPRAVLLWQGPGVAACGSGRLALLEGASALAETAACLGLASLESPWPVLVLRHHFDLELVAARVVESANADLAIFIEARLDEHTGILPDETYNYALFELAGAPAGLRQQDLLVSLSWLGGPL